MPDDRPPLDSFQIKSEKPPLSSFHKDTETKPSRSVIDKLLGRGGERYQLFPERAVREIGSDIVGLVKKAEQAPISPEGAASLAPEAFKVATEVSPMTPLARGRAAFGVFPTKEQIKESGEAAYKLIEDERLIASEGSINDLVSATRASLDRRLFDKSTARRTFLGLEQLEKSGGDIAGIINTYSNLGKIKPSEEADFAAAQHVRDAIRTYVDNLPATEVASVAHAGAVDPKFTAEVWQHARESWRAYAELEAVDSALAIGKHRAAVSGTGANTQNAMRQRIREILDSDTKSRGFSKDAKDQMEDIVVGTWLTNRARWMGKYAPSGPVSSMAAVASYFAGAGGEHGLSGTKHGLTAAAAIAIPATIAKYLGTFLTKQQIARLEEIIKSESPLGRSMEKQRSLPKEMGAGRTAITGAGVSLPEPAPDQEWINRYLQGGAT